MKKSDIAARVAPTGVAASGFPVDQLDDLIRRLPHLGRTEGETFIADICAAREQLLDSEDTWES